MKSINHFIITAILALLLSFSSITPSSGTSASGGYIYYKQTDSLVYDVWVHLYRDCRGVSMPDSFTKIFGVGCVSGSSVSNRVAVPMGRISIKDVSILCSSAKSPCSPPNTYGTGEGIEEHTYFKRIDLSRSEYANIRSCGKLIFDISYCCRSGAISTGPANQNMYIYSEVDRTNGKRNSSPKFIGNLRLQKLAANVRNQINFTAEDTIDHDSLSYRLVNPLRAYNNVVSYANGYSKDKPLTPYDPYGLGLIEPNTDPPYGFFIDSVRGIAVFTPTNGAEVTVMDFEVTEWRKNSSGKMVVVGRSINEVLYSTYYVSIYNNPPKIDVKPTYNICAGDSFSVTIKTSDRAFVPPPPDTAAGPDTLTVSWYEFDKPGWNIEVLDSPKVQPVIRITWQTDSTMIREKPYSVNLHVTDNFCLRPGVADQLVKIYVNPIPKIKTVYDPVSCGRFALSVQSSSHLNKLKWRILDTNGVQITDPDIVSFASGYKGTSERQTDTVQIRKTGKYILFSEGLSLKGCSVSQYDTITASYSEGINLFDVRDSSFCDNWQFVLYPNLIDTNTYSGFQWNNPVGSKTAIVHLNHADSITDYVLNAFSPDGCPQTDTFSVATYFSPKIDKLPNIAHCMPLSESVDLSKYTGKGGLATQYLWSDAVQGETRVITSPGKYSVVAINDCGFDSASFTVKGYQSPKVEKINDTTVCIPVNEQFTATDRNQNSETPDSYKWNTGDTTPTTSISTEGHYTVVVSNICGADSTGFTLSSLNSPDANLGPDTMISLPFTFQLTSDSIEGDYLWSTGESSQSIVVNDTGSYWVTNSNKCGSSSDTIHISAPVSVGEINGKPIVVYPNPNQGDFVIRHEGLSDVTIRISDINGKMIQPMQLEHYVGITAVKLGELPSGIYMLEVFSENKIFTTRIRIE